MAQYKKNQKTTVSPQTVSEAEALAKATQRPGQTKEQTKLIAQGIQKGIEEYKKRQKGKARELDKKLKKVAHQQDQVSQQCHTSPDNASSGAPKLPWLLLGLSWFIFAVSLALLLTS